jgi:pimeloyl-ACP methyl ester carboxylesterase
MKLPCCLLPGLDGTGVLFDPLLAVLPSSVEARPFSYPHDLVSYETLLEWIGPRLPEKPCCLIAESFSGPLALHCAARYPEKIKKVILVCSFIAPPQTPLLRLLRLLPLRPVFSVPLPPLIARIMLLGRDATTDLVRQTLQAIRSVPAQTLAARLRTVLSLRSDSFPDVQQPILCLQARSDRLVPASAARTIARRYPHAEIIPLEGPHFLLQARPADSVRFIETFVRS